jgi:hypothetical protein
MALLDVLANVFTADALGATKKAARSETDRFATQPEKLDQLQKVILGANRSQSDQTDHVCNRDIDYDGLPPFQLQDGFLLETGTGRVWRYDEERDAFIELRFLSSPVGERVSPEILADQIQTTENEIERVLCDIPSQQKQAVRSALEDNYKKALVWALVQSRALTAETSTMAAR